ncbi:MAG: dicarboxylate/amino acid:cation symporter [Pirellulaceae bacterium]|nr:dicarboxylate/amino acid:cation symporter [Pirellulaceae bacterium]
MESPRQKRPLWQVWNWKLHWQILLGMALGILTGYGMARWAIGAAGVAEAAKYLEYHWVRLLSKTGGEMFLNALKMVVIPLVTSSITLAIGAIAARHGFARLGLKTLIYFLATTLAAVLIGLVLVNWVQPGVTDGEPLLTREKAAQIQETFASESKRLADSAALHNERTGETLFSKVLGVFKSLIPANPIKAAAEMDLLGLIVIALFFGFFMSRLTGPVRETLQNFWQGINDVSLMFTEFILKLAPLGIGMLLAHTIMDNYVALAAEDRVADLVGALWRFGVTAAIALAIHMFIFEPLVFMAFTGQNPRKLFKAIMPALFTAFSTSSSNATLSVTMECVEKNAGVSGETAGFVLPLGATVNMNGTALYECVAAMFVVQLFGYQLDFAAQFMVVLIALLTSIGVAGVPSASLVAIIIILNSVSKQLGPEVDLTAGLAILMILDRPLDMFRTAVNVFGDATGAILIAKTENEDIFPTTPKTP